jgi:hypothetical protein
MTKETFSMAYDAEISHIFFKTTYVLEKSELLPLDHI